MIITGQIPSTSGTEPPATASAVEVEDSLPAQPRPVRQLRLLPVPRPLTERLGRALFLSIPRLPGVYRFYDAQGALLYVGKSKCLRDRLNSYRHVHPDRDSRKTIRLVHRAARLDWVVCETHEEAVLLENQWLRSARPPFNRANTWPNACLFLGLASENESISLRVNRENQQGWRWFGAFRPTCIPVHAALVRCLHIALRRPASIGCLPLGFVSGRMPRSYSVEIPCSKTRGEWSALLESYLLGEAATVVDRLRDSLADWVAKRAAESALTAADLELLNRFFQTGASRLARWRASRPQGEDVDCLTPEELLDLQAVESVRRDELQAAPMGGQAGLSIQA